MEEALGEWQGPGVPDLLTWATVCLQLWGSAQPTRCTRNVARPASRPAPTRSTAVPTSVPLAASAQKVRALPPGDPSRQAQRQSASPHPTWHIAPPGTLEPSPASGPHSVQGGGTHWVSERPLGGGGLTLDQQRPRVWARQHPGWDAAVQTGLEPGAGRAEEEDRAS